MELITRVERWTLKYFKVEKMRAWQVKSQRLVASERISSAAAHSDLREKRNAKIRVILSNNILYKNGGINDRTSIVF
jgi:predicted site-specific integrase-resolvase